MLHGVQRSGQLLALPATAHPGTVKGKAARVSSTSARDSKALKSTLDSHDDTTLHPLNRMMLTSA